MHNFSATFFSVPVSTGEGLTGAGSGLIVPNRTLGNFYMKAPVRFRIAGMVAHGNTQGRTSASQKTPVPLWPAIAVLGPCQKPMNSKKSRLIKANQGKKYLGLWGCNGAGSDWGTTQRLGTRPEACVADMNGRNFSARPGGFRLGGRTSA